MIVERAVPKLHFIFAAATIFLIFLWSFYELHKSDVRRRRDTVAVGQMQAPLVSDIDDESRLEGQILHDISLTGGIGNDEEELGQPFDDQIEPSKNDIYNPGSLQSTSPVGMSKLSPTVQATKTFEATIPATSLYPAPPTRNTPLILYAYSDSDWAFDNLKFFLNHGVHAHATFAFLLNGAITSDSTSPIPESISRALDLLHTFEKEHREATISIIQRPNKCFDVGAYGEVLLANQSALYRAHQHFLLINASVRGPFLPLWSRECWSDAYLQPIVKGSKDEEGRPVKMVGMTQNCDWPGPNHVQSMVLAMDAEAMGILLRIIPTPPLGKEPSETTTQNTVAPDPTEAHHRPAKADEDLQNFKERLSTATETSSIKVRHHNLGSRSTDRQEFDPNGKRDSSNDDEPTVPRTEDGIAIHNLARCPSSMWEAVHIEWSLTQLLHKHNYTATSILALTHANHFSLASSPSAENNHTCSNGDVNAAPGAYEGQSLHFWETMFIKVRWSVMPDAVEQTSMWLDKVVEGAWAQHKNSRHQKTGQGFGLRRGSWDVCRNELLEGG